MNGVKRDVQTLYNRIQPTKLTPKRPNDNTTPTAPAAPATPQPAHSDVVASNQTAEKSPDHSTSWSDDADAPHNPTPTRKPSDVPKMSYATAAAKKKTRIITTGTRKSGLEASQYESSERLFISFLKPSTTESQLQKYIRHHIGCDTICEKLEHRYKDDFSSFKVTIRKRFVDNVLNGVL